MVLVALSLLTVACADDAGDGDAATDDRPNAPQVEPVETSPPAPTGTDAGSADPDVAGTTVTDTPDGATDDAAAPAPDDDPSGDQTAEQPADAPADPPPDLAAVAVDLEPIGRFEQPVDLVEHDGALWIVEQPGRVVRLASGSTDIVADVADRISAGGEQGLLGIALRDDRAYLDYTDRDGATTVSEVPVAEDGTFDLDDERVVLRIDQPFSNHNAGDLLIDGDGNLVVPLGDGGSGGDPQRHGADPSTLLGSIVRIDVTPSDDAPYSIPDDNPFAAGGPGRPEVWAWGLRNPWRVDLDPVTGDLWIADVGQGTQEEINFVPGDGTALPGRGDFYGWSAFEGDLVFNTDVDGTGAVAPAHTYDHGDDGCSVSGGAVYRGEAIDGLRGAYVYGDYCSGRLWAFDPFTGDNVLLRDDLTGLTAVRRGADGELYALQHGGDVWRIVPIG